MDESTISSTYIPDGAQEFFATLQAATRLDDVRHFYRILGQTLHLAAEQKTAFNGLTLGGLYAKIDYLMKERHFTPVAIRTINAARVRTNKAENISPEELVAHRLYDLKAVCCFIAIIFEAEIPETLRLLFPAEDDGSSKTTVSSQKLPHYLRVTVNRWDEEAIYVRSAELDLTEVAVLLKTEMTDWSYMKSILTENAQLNLVRPRWIDGALSADLLVLNPDYLVDITSITKCFEDYSTSPFLHLLHKISSFSQSEAILLGNFAGQLLDEAIHGKYDESADSGSADNGSNAVEITFDKSFEAFVRENIMTILALEAEGQLDLERLKSAGRAQLEHILWALRQGLERFVGNYDRSKVMLEPSFISEMLGLQGRMDFLQLDYKVLIEQKSGKGAFAPKIPGMPEVPRQQTQHYVQMLLYMALLRYNFNDQYAKNHGQLQAFLLYSRYEEPLLGLGFAPQLFFEAMKVRNGLVWYENYYCAGGARVLEKMTPDRINRNQVHSKLWEAYQKPALASLLAPIQEATPLERDYYFRLLQFVANEHMMAKVGNNTAQSNCYASKWYNTLAEKHDGGEIYDNLELDETSLCHEGAVEFVEFQLPLSPDTAVNSDTTNFRRGDIVIFYPYPKGTEPDCRRTMVFRANLVEISATKLTVKLRASQSDAMVFLRDKDKPWAIEHDMFESSFSGLYTSLHAFLSAPQERRDLLLLQREPNINPSAKIRGEYANFNELSLRVKQAEDFFLIIGPPGTGKTSFGMLNTLKEQLMEPGSNVLVLSYTNRAVDEICSKLVEEGIDFIRMGNPHNCEPDYHPYLLNQRIEGLSPDEVKELLLTTRVFVGTTTTMSSQHALFGLKHFELAIIDEASQILEPHLLGLLSMQHDGVCAIRKFVMIGDHKQLPAVVQQSPEQTRVTEPRLHEIGFTDCRSSLFERLLQRYGKNPAVTYLLTRQGRMHQDIAEFPNQAFYNGRLGVVPLPHQVELSDVARISFIAAPAPDEMEVLSDKVNPEEARIIARLVSEIYQANADDFCLEKTIGVIVPYRNQIAAIRNLLPTGLRDITIDTVERYQGSQRDHIIYGFTIRKNYQLAFLTNNVFEEEGSVIDRKLNVAMTRARKHLILVGNEELLSRNRTFRRLIEFTKFQGGYKKE